MPDKPPLTAADELAHPPGDGDYWGESWYLDFTDADGSLGGYVRLGLYPNLGRAWYWACLVGEGRELVTVIDHEVPLPRSPSLEIRTEGLWGDLIVETPFDHVTVGCEAFGIRVDDPAETYRGLRGDRVPFGLDLEWETDGGVYDWPAATRYEIPCRVHGEILVGDERIDFDGIGQRDHSWGVRDWWQFGWVWTAGHLADGTHFHGSDIRVEGLDFAAGYVGTAPFETITSPMHATESLGDEGLPHDGHITLAPLELDVEPVAFSPVLLTAEDGRESRFARALCRFRDQATDRTGVGWTEWLQPPSA